MKILKRIGIVVGVVLSLLVLTAIIAPFVIDVDKYRPEIVRLANQRIKGQLSIGKLSLSLWGTLKIDIAGIELKDSSGEKVLAVKDANVQMPFMSLFTGAPRVTLKLARPDVVVKRHKNGAINLMGLIPDKGNAPPTDSASPASPSMTLPALFVRARLGLECRDAQLSYRDASKDDEIKITDLDFLVHDLSLERKSTFELGMTIGASLPDSNVKGPVKVHGNLLPNVGQGQLLGAQVSMTADLTGLQVTVPGVFEKSSSIPLTGSIDAEYSPEAVKISKLVFQFHTLKASGEGVLTRAEPATVKFSLASGDADLASFASLFPGLNGAKFSGFASLNAELHGPVSSLGYSAELALKKFKIEGGLAKQPVLVEAAAKVVTDRVERFDVTVSSAGQDLRLDGKVQSFSRPKVDVKVLSKSFDVDAMFNLAPLETASGGSKSKASAESGGKGETGSGSGTAASAAADRDALLAPLQKNDIARATTVTALVDLAKVKAYDISIVPIRAKAELAALKLKIPNAEMGVFGGRIAASGSVDLSSKVPTYQFKTDIKSLDLGAASRSQLALFRNTFTGHVYADCKGSGASFNTPKAKAALSVQGSFRVADAVFSTIDVGKMVSEGLNGAIERASAQVPLLKNAKIQPLPSGKAEYEQMSASFSIQKGVFDMPNFVARSRPGQGIDLDGRTKFGLIDGSLDAQWKVIDRNNITKARDISVNFNGVDIPHILAKGDEPFSFPVTVGCKATSPCYSYGELPGHLASVALDNMGQAAARKAKQELEAKGKELLQKQLGDQLKKGLDGLFKR